MLTNKVITTLEEYAECDESEWSELIVALLNVYNRRGMLSPELTNLIENELQGEHDAITEQWEIVETTHTQTYTSKSLEERE